MEWKKIITAKELKVGDTVRIHLGVGGNTSVFTVTEDHLKNEEFRARALHGDIDMQVVSEKEPSTKPLPNYKMYPGIEIELKVIARREYKKSQDLYETEGERDKALEKLLGQIAKGKIVSSWISFAGDLIPTDNIARIISIEIEGYEKKEVEE